MGNQTTPPEASAESDVQKEETVRKTSAANELEELKKKCEEYLEGWKRAKADYANLQKEIARERQEMAKFAALDLIHQLLDVYSHMKLAFQHIPDSVKKEPWMVGFEHIQKQIWDVLKGQGVEAIPTVGHPFDPHVHEAVEQKEKETGKGQDGSEKADVVVTEVSPGFTLQGRVIRPAKVVVGQRQDRSSGKKEPEEKGM